MLLKIGTTQFQTLTYMPSLYLYRISVEKRLGYDNFDSAIVVATSMEHAKTIHPNGGIIEKEYQYGWVDSAEKVQAELLAIYSGNKYEAGSVVLSSFNAG